MMTLRVKACLAAVFAGAIASGAAPPANAFEAVSLGTFDRPVYVGVAPGAPDLLFVVEQPGRIQVLRNEQRQPAPFLDISGLVRATPDPGAGGEEGLLSVAFPPNYAKVGFFYVFYVNANGNLEVDEFRRSGNRLWSNPSTRRIVLLIPHRTATNHNGGQLQFGPDGLLFISTGDGGHATPPGDPARDLGSLLGKLLRIDPLRRTGSLHYYVPLTNPFIGKPGRNEIYAYGFRNPWRFSFDNGRIAIGDVGESRQEEVDFLATPDARGVNFGWPQYEGDLLFDAARPGAGPPKFPMFTYDHTGGRCAIIGGYVVRDPNLPSLAGRYLYGDACSGEVRSFVAQVSSQEAAGDAPTGLVLPGLSGFGRGFGGKIYVAQSSGTVSQLEPDAP